MKIRTEISENEEIIIRCRERNDKIRSLEAAIEETLRGEHEIVLCSDGTDYFVPKISILFFESFDGKVYAHTRDRIYTAPYKLFELESLMPSSFVRISKSAIANIAEIAFLHRELVGNGEIGFRNCSKKVYFSRAYFKLLQYKIDEMRLKK
ncbi:MAG: LytTR family transcriptional regulator [Clostridia bacterium]|nr:LytTR family transcriptional regulator [Clostridia bacterium]